MPSGHTDKRTLTPYRAKLLRSAEVRGVLKVVLNHNDRKQFGLMSQWGWAADDGDMFVVTAEGRALLKTLDVAK